MALSHNGRSLQYASEDLQADEEIVLVAVYQNGCALEFSKGDLNADKKVVLLAVAENSFAMHWASNDLQEGGLRRHMNDLDFSTSWLHFVSTRIS